MKYQITITGYDWESCYLQLPEVRNTKQQVLDDLQIVVDRQGSVAIKGDQFEVDVLDHSMAMEFFVIVDINQNNNTVEMEYAGGIS